MRSWQYALGAVFLILLVFVVNFVKAPLYVSDNTNVAVPDENGTSTLLNITSRMQQYVGFYGRIWAEVRRTATVGSGTMYNRTMDRGFIYFFKNGATPTYAFVPAINNSETDGNFSLTNYYITGNHYMNNGTICGIAAVDHLNTTDSYAVGIFHDSAATPNYFLCTDIQIKVSTNGFDTTDGNVAFEVVVPKTSSYQAYDVWIDGELVG
ncbi:MAG: hypothetical protein V1835_02300 [Candidatus Micrarchaeota archaeon]